MEWAELEHALASGARCDHNPHTSRRSLRESNKKPFEIHVHVCCAYCLPLLPLLKRAALKSRLLWLASVCPRHRIGCHEHQRPSTHAK